MVYQSFYAFIVEGDLSESISSLNYMWVKMCVSIMCIVMKSYVKYATGALV